MVGRRARNILCVYRGPVFVSFRIRVVNIGDRQLALRRFATIVQFFLPAVALQCRVSLRGMGSRKDVAESEQEHSYGDYGSG